MATNKEKLAAILINHWYVIETGFQSGRLKKKPASKKYKQLPLISNLTDAEIVELGRGFAGWNIKHFIANLVYVANTFEIFKTKNIKINISPPASAGATVVEWEIPTIFRELYALRKALCFSAQNGNFTNAIEALPNLLHSPQYGDTIQGSTIPENGKAEFSLSLSKASIAYSYIDMETKFMEALRALMLLIEMNDRVIAGMTIEQKKEIYDNKSLLRVNNFSIKDYKILSMDLTLEETEETRTARRARERLEEALRRRTQKASSTNISDRNIQYEIESNSAGNHAPIIVNIENLLD